MAIKEDYYKVLGILCDAADADIKKAYRIQARQHHPDKAEDKEAAHALFVKIGEAYDVLSNPKKRTDYD
ncbi:DnaJ domain-containing protein, partial [Pseudomassariella vexata]